MNLIAHIWLPQECARESDILHHQAVASRTGRQDPEDPRQTSPSDPLSAEEAMFEAHHTLQEPTFPPWREMLQADPLEQE